MPRQKFGLRVAQGARPNDILLLALRPSVKLLLAGVALGRAASVAVTRLMSNLLFGVSANDPPCPAGLPMRLPVLSPTVAVLP